MAGAYAPLSAKVDEWTSATSGTLTVMQPRTMVSLPTTV